MPRLQDPSDPIWTPDNRIYFSKFGLTLSETTATPLTNDRYPCRSGDAVVTDAYARLMARAPLYLGDVFVNTRGNESNNYRRFPEFTKNSPTFGIITGLFINERVDSNGCDSHDFQVRITSIIPGVATYDTLWWLDQAYQSFRRPACLLRNERLISRVVRPRGMRGTNCTERLAISWGGPPLISFSTLYPDYVRHVRQRIDEYVVEYLGLPSCNAMRPATPAVPATRAPTSGISSGRTTTGRGRITAIPAEPSTIRWAGFETPRAGQAEPGAPETAAPISYFAEEIPPMTVAQAAAMSRAYQSVATFAYASCAPELPSATSSQPAPPPTNTNLEAASEDI